MKVSQDSWHTRIYMWWYRNKYDRTATKQSTNLCPYMRAILFWAPLRALFSSWVKVPVPGTNRSFPLNIITLSALIIELPRWLGMKSYMLKEITLMIYLLSAIATVIVFTAMLITEWCGKHHIGGRLENKLSDSADYISNKLYSKRLDTFGTLFREFLRSSHDGICPQIEIVGGPDEANPPDSSNTPSCCCDVCRNGQSN